MPASGNAVLLAEAEELDWHLLVSSNVNACAYAPDFQRLYVEFKGGPGRSPALYVYHGVPKGVYLALLSAPSAGRYVFREIRKNGTDSFYAYEQLY